MGAKPDSVAEKELCVPGKTTASKLRSHSSAEPLQGSGNVPDDVEASPDAEAMVSDTASVVDAVAPVVASPTPVVPPEAAGSSAPQPIAARKTITHARGVTSPAIQRIVARTSRPIASANRSDRYGPLGRIGAATHL